MKYIVYFILCFLQPICLLTPEATTIYLGVSTLGGVKAFFIGLAGILLGILFMYKVTFFLGNKYLKKVINSKKFKAYQKYMSSNPFLTTGILFAIPVIPDEIICIGSALGNIPFKILFPIVIFSKSISIGMVTFSESIAKAFSIESWVVVLCEIVIMLILALLYKLIYRKKEFIEN